MERMVSLQMAFVDSKSGQYQAFCAAYEQDPTKPVAIRVVPCQKESPSESQKFAYNPETSVLRAIWSKEHTADMPAKKRQVKIGGPGGAVKAKGAESVVVMVFQAANTTSSSSTSPQDLTGQGAPASAENSTTNPFTVNLDGRLFVNANDTVSGRSMP
jgi:hypothetical protein